MLKKIRMRSLIIGGFFTLFFLVLIGRLFYVQVIQADWLTAKAAGQWNSTETLAANRGMIMDRNDKTLAEDTLAYSIAVNPRDIKKLDVLDEVVSGLTKILGSENGNNENLEKKIRETATKEKPKDENAQAANSSTDTKSTAGENYDYLLAQVELRPEGMQLDSVKAKQVQDLIASIKQHLTERDSKTYPKNKVQKESVGITVMESTKRFYPNKSLAAHIIGYINREGTPQMGLEQQEDEILKGIPGKLNLQTDLKGVEAPGNSQKILQEPVDGKNIRLTIDNNIQFYVEDALSEAYKKYKPKSLSAIVADVNTMEILGMASYPNFNPNEFYKTDGKKGEFVNNAIQSVYEPGSTFKAVTLAASIQENLFKPSDYYHSGSIKIGDTLIKDHNNGAGWGDITYLEGLKRSSNVAFVKIGQQLGMEKQLQYVKNFGFGEKTGLDLAGEKKGKVIPERDIEYATMSFGQGPITTTAIQQLTAYAAIVNGGKLMQPHIIKDIVDPKTGQPVQSFEPVLKGEPISVETSKKAGEYLEQVVSDQKIGTGRHVYLDDYRVGGKTGTAQKVINGSYAGGNKYVVSFIGHAPVENPQVAIIIIADEPQLQNYTEAGDVTSKPFKSIMYQTLKYLQVPSSNSKPANTEDQNGPLTVTMPDLNGKTVPEAKKITEEQGLNVTFLGEGDKVQKQLPDPGVQVQPSQRIYAALSPIDNIAVPDLKGLSFREAAEIASFLNVKVIPKGEGFVVSQSLEGEGTTRILKLKLQPLTQVKQ